MIDQGKIILQNRAMAIQNQIECATSEDSDQPGHPPSQIRVFVVRSMGSYLGPRFLHAESEDWSDWANAKADLSSLGAHSLCWFCHVMAQLCLQPLNTRPKSCCYQRVLFLTHIWLMDFSILINWISPFQILGVSGAFFYFDFIFDRISCKQTV